MSHSLTHHAPLHDLTAFDLTPNQSRLYQAGLLIWSRSVSTYAKYTGLKRVLTFNVLQELCSKGLATCVTIWKTGYYAMQDPKMLHQQLLEKADAFWNLLPSLQSMLLQSSWSFRVQVFQWIDGMKTLYNHLLDTKTDFKAFLGADHIEPHFREYLYSVYLPKRLERKIKSKTIVSQTAANTHFAKTASPLTEARILNTSVFDPTNEIILFDGNKIVFANLSSSEMSGVLMESSNTYTTIEQIFDILWMQAKPLPN